MYFHQYNPLFQIITLGLIGSILFLTIGTYEDLFPNTSPLLRLISTFLVATVFIVISFTSANNYGKLLTSGLSENYYLLISFIIFLATLTHAHNIVDGLNGLSSGSAIFAFFAAVYLALQGNDFELVYFGMLLISITLAFLIFNYPIAKIFLGDGGAYWVGSSIAILSLLLLTRNPSISIWTILLINFYPLFETIFSIFRKFFIYKASPFRPDAYHLHMITFRIIGHLNSKQKIACVAPPYVNPLSSFALLLLPLLSATLAVISRSSFPGQIISLIALSGIYTILYWKLKRYEEGLAPALSSAYKNMI